MHKAGYWGGGILDNLNETATPIIDNQEAIHAKGFDLFDFGLINALETN